MSNTYLQQKIHEILRCRISWIINWRRHPDLNRGIRVLQTHALPLGYVALSFLRGANAPLKSGAGDEARTRYLHLGKVALYQMSYARIPRNIILHQTIFTLRVVPPVGIEPTTRGFSVPCSTN